MSLRNGFAVEAALHVLARGCERRVQLLKLQHRSHSLLLRQIRRPAGAHASGWRAAGILIRRLRKDLRLILRRSRTLILSLILYGRRLNRGTASALIRVPAATGADLRRIRLFILRVRSRLCLCTDSRRLHPLNELPQRLPDR